MSSIFSTSTTTPKNALSEAPKLPTSVNEVLDSISELLPSSSSSSRLFAKTKSNPSKTHSKLVNQLDNDDVDLDKDALFGSDRMTFVDHVVSDIEDDDEEEGELQALQEQGYGNKLRMRMVKNKEAETLAQMRDLKNEVRKTIESLDMRSQSSLEKNQRLDIQNNTTEQIDKKRDLYSTISSSSSSYKPSFPPTKKKKLDQVNAYMQAKYGSTPFRSSSNH